MENNPIDALIGVLKQCAEANVTVALVFRCSVDTLPEAQKNSLISNVAQSKQITLEDAEANLRGAATSMSMTNASPDMGENALLSMVAEFSILQGNLANDVLIVEEQRLQTQKASGPRIIVPGT